MALSVSYSYEDHLGNILEAQDELCKKHNDAQSGSLLIRALVDQLLTTILPPPYDASPPGYEDSVNDLPPDYTSTDVLVTSAYPKSPLHIHTPVARTTTSNLDVSWPEKSERIDVDLTTPHNIRSHANKKAKQAAKAAKTAKWADSGDEGEGSKGGEGGSANGGDGGSAAGGAGGGDDGGDDAGSKKNKKGKKKGKKDEDDEEEKKDEDAGANADNFWDNLDTGEKAGDANADDEWATGATSKKKGKKGKKVCDLT